MIIQNGNSELTSQKLLKRKFLRTVEEVEAVSLLDDPYVSALLINTFRSRNSEVRDAASRAVLQRKEEGFQALLLALKRHSGLRVKCEDGCPPAYSRFG